MIEVLGIIATFIVFVSLTQKNQKKFRILNGIGSVLFVIYGTVLQAWSVCILNACCAIVDFWYLFRPDDVT